MKWYLAFVFSLLHPPRGISYCSWPVIYLWVVFPRFFHQMRSAMNQNCLALNLISCPSEFKPIQLHDVSLKCRPRNTPGVWEGQGLGWNFDKWARWTALFSRPKSFPFSKNISNSADHTYGLRTTDLIWEVHPRIGHKPFFAIWCFANHACQWIFSRPGHSHRVSNHHLLFHGRRFSVQHGTSLGQREQAGRGFQLFQVTW